MKKLIITSLLDITLFTQQACTKRTPTPTNNGTINTFTGQMQQLWG